MTAFSTSSWIKGRSLAFGIGLALPLLSGIADLPELLQVFGRDQTPLMVNSTSAALIAGSNTTEYTYEDTVLFTSRTTLLSKN